jgi:hypothetical protein
VLSREEPNTNFIVLSPERVKPNTMKLVFGSSLLSTQHNGEKSKTGWFGIRIPCFSGMTWQSSDCCISELAMRFHPEEQNNRVEIYHHLDGYINIIEIHRNLDEKQTRDIKNITIRKDHRRKMHHSPDITEKNQRLVGSESGYHVLVG